jgi:chemotaxis protein MotB
LNHPRTKFPFAQLIFSGVGKRSFVVVSNEYEQHPSQTDQGLGHEGEHDEEPSIKPSSGLIRAGIFGVILFLAVIGMASVLNNWFRGSISDVEEKLAVIEAKTAIEDSSSPYKKLEQSWLQTRALLETELQNKRVLTASVGDYGAQIEAAKQNSVKAENAMTVAQTTVERYQTELSTISEKISDLEDQTPQEAFEEAQLAASSAAEAAEKAQRNFQKAKGEQSRIKATVVELRRAVSAADAAAKASRLVVSAADAAKQAVDENQDVMSESDGPALTNLENNFFKDAELQATNMERSAQAARQAVEVAELRLASLKREEAKFQDRFTEANKLEQTAKAGLAKVEKEVEAHLLQMHSLQTENDTAQTRLRAAERQSEEKKQDYETAMRDIAVLEGKLDTTKKSITTAETTLEVVEAKFQETEAALKELHRARAEKNAASMAVLNGQLNERLRGQLSGAAPDHPIFDRLVFSSAELFAQGSSELQQSGKDALLKVVPVLEEIIKEMPKDLDWVLRVDGHTDSLPISGTGRFKDNWELSQARALSVVRFLVKATEIKPQQLSANGYGEFQPLTQETSPVSLAKNRRIELTLAAR